ncbi:hypothetical protein [Spirosoma rhododendri]|uniref:Uncharacterized protein n=1 Tax=Spirosoma rhododendri TaxID=2728024 RepID=A0A7L5DNU5_9BACT|nr:hypothetical protein [Spirosoma rhododendri]QJD79745.1 hypothetical protein HH216_15915 [Spirosoma rhododendri]
MSFDVTPLLVGYKTDDPPASLPSTPITGFHRPRLPPTNPPRTIRFITMVRRT